MPHLLKRLELNGFKSFAGKTVLEFPAGITAIVGPNGSGKSNVVDAIRWLLGERDTKNLRGAKVEDLIFAGTIKRPRMGQAQASLHFENKNKFFPVDFAEVTVSRQVSRDGASQYFLNKSEILLRDLVDFFAKARLGSRGLIIIGQGNSDVFIESSPQERREMMEEILGLREYQIKRADAERRLKNSVINLDKVKALIEEILPHLRSLRRQTSRWEKRGTMEEELRSSENEFFGSQLAEIRKELVEVRQKIDASKGEFGILEKAKRAAEEHQRNVEGTLPQERKDLQKIKEQTQTLLVERSKLQKDLGRMEAQIEMSKASSSEGKHSAAKLVGLIKDIRRTLQSALEGDAVEIRDGIRQAIEDIDDALAGDAEDSTSSLPDTGLASQFEKINKDLRSLEEKIAALRDQEQNLEQSQEAFYTTFKAGVAEVEKAKDALEKWEAKNREHLFEKEKIEFRREEIHRQILQAGRNPKEFESDETGIGSADLSGLDKKIFKLRGELASIGEIDEGLVKEAKETETRYEFLEKESGDLEKAVADLKELIEELSKRIKNEFEKSLHKINDEFDKFFNLMFDGGTAKLSVKRQESRLRQGYGGQARVKRPESEEDVIERGDEGGTEEEQKEESGVEIDIKLARKRITSLEMLSGGERSLVGIAALFALISVSPPPFLVLDEIDAALDERNARRFAEMLKEFSRHTQFVVVTHNRATMEAANVLYGITLGEDGTSKILSLKLEN